MIQALSKIDYNKNLIYMLLESRTGAVVVNIVGPLFFLYVFYNAIPLEILYTLTFVQMFSFVFRIQVGVSLYKSLEKDSAAIIKKYLKKYLIFIFINSFLWGVSTVLAVKYGSQVQIFMVMTLVFGMITGSMSTLTPIFHAVFIFVLNIISMFILSLVFIGANETYYFVAFFLTVYMFVSIPAAYRIHLSMSNSIIKNEEIEMLNSELEKKVTKAIQEREKKEKLLQQQTRLAQMGEMISMIAHQWRQPLGAISSSVISIQTKKESGIYDFTKEKDRTTYFNFVDQKFQNVHEYVQILSTTIDDFRNFFKPDKEKEQVKLTLPIQRALTIVQSSMHFKNIEFVILYNNDDTIFIYQNEMMQVILNILKNAEDNFIEKKTKNAKVTIKTELIDNEYKILISDNGGGIQESILPHIFEPYFSTKNEKNGTGLGLYMSKIMIEEHHNGKLNVGNTVDGAYFEILLKKEINV